jgi:DNA-binding MarR family transcriptional regulator
MNELSRRMMVTGGNVTGIVDQLVKEGLVARVVEPADRRAFRVHLTRAGDKAFAEMARAHEEWVVALLARLGRRDSDALMQLLARLKQVTLEKSA